MLQWSAVVATICEVPPVACLPNFIVQRKLLQPFRTQTGGTIMVSMILFISSRPKVLKIWYFKCYDTDSDIIKM